MKRRKTERSAKHADNDFDNFDETGQLDDSFEVVSAAMAQLERKWAAEEITRSNQIKKTSIRDAIENWHERRELERDFDECSDVRRWAKRRMSRSFQRY